MPDPTACARVARWGSSDSPAKVLLDCIRAEANQYLPPMSYSHHEPRASILSDLYLNDWPDFNIVALDQSQTPSFPLSAV